MACDGFFTRGDVLGCLSNRVDRRCEHGARNTIEVVSSCKRVLHFLTGCFSVATVGWLPLGLLLLEKEAVREENIWYFFVLLSSKNASRQGVAW